jgi:hypothetical protein
MIIDEMKEMEGCPLDLKMWVEPYQRSWRAKTNLSATMKADDCVTRINAIADRLRYKYDLSDWNGLGATLAGSGHRMAKNSNGKLLEVAVIERDRASWEWQVEHNGTILVCGFEKTKLEARFAGNDAMFLILASGRDL